MAGAPGIRLCVVTDLLTEPADMGERVFARGFIRALRTRVPTVAIATPVRHGQDVSPLADQAIPGNRTFFDLELARAVRSARPTHIVYMPGAAMKLTSCLRTRVLSMVSGGVPVAMIGLSPASLGPVERLLARLALTHMVAVTPGLGCEMDHLVPRERVVVLPPAVDADRFAPVPEVERRRLRDKYQVPQDACVYLHVGHVLESRNVHVMRELAREPGSVAIIVASTSTRHDGDLSGLLAAAGVRVERGFYSAVEEWYRLADCYVFAVRAPEGCIDVPASVIEAMAADLPVATTPFGALPHVFAESVGLAYASTDADLVEAAKRVVRVAEPGTRALVEQMTWESVADALLDGLTRLAPSSR